MSTTAHAQVVTDSTATVTEPSWTESIKASLDGFAPELDRAYYSTGIEVYDLTADSVIWQYNAHKVMRPASCQKLITTISAMDILGTQYIISTRALHTGTIADSTLRGNIYVKGAFDPTLTYSDVKTMAGEIRALGIDTIYGNIYADTSFKDTLLYGNGWCWDDEPSVFTPYLSPLLFDRGKLTPKRDKYPTSIFHNPAVHFIRTLRNEVEALGVCIVAGDSAEIHNAPSSAKMFYNHNTPLTELLPRALKNSDNLYAEAIFSHIAHFNTGAHCTATDGARLVYNIIRKSGASSTYCDIHDGSGLSPYDFVSPSCLVAMLRFAYRNTRIYNAISPALPTAGKDGTLQSRMKTGPAHLNVHAKTGTVTGVSSLAGYITASNGHLLAFAIINNGNLKSSTTHNLQDRICQELAR